MNISMRDSLLLELIGFIQHSYKMSFRVLLILSLPRPVLPGNIDAARVRRQYLGHLRRFEGI